MENLELSQFNNFIHRVKILPLLTSIRGGSKLFHSLLDGHNQIICLPRTFQLSGFLRKIDTNSSVEIPAIFCEEYPRFFDGREWRKKNILDRADELGPNKNETFVVDQSIFQKEFYGILSKHGATKINIFYGIHLAYAKATFRDIDQIEYILYHIHDVSNLIDIDLCFEIFPEDKLKFIFTSRHPIEGLNACVEWMIVQNMISPLNSYIYETYEATAPIFIKHPNADIRTVRLEDIRHNRKKVMDAFCQWLSITFQDSMLKSTIHGKAWQGNGRTPLGDNLLNNNALYEPRNFFEKKDLSILTAFFPKRMASFGIKSPKDHSKFTRTLFLILPMKQELSLLKRSLTLSYWKNAYTNSQKNNQNFSNLFKIGNPLVMILFYLKRIPQSLWIVFTTKDIPFSTLGYRQSDDIT